MCTYIDNHIRMSAYFSDSYKQLSNTNAQNLIQTSILDGLLICLSESGLMQAMLLNHNLARSHMSFIRNNLRDSQIFVLQVRNLNYLMLSKDLRFCQYIISH